MVPWQMFVDPMNWRSMTEAYFARKHRRDDFFSSFTRLSAEVQFLQKETVPLGNIIVRRRFVWGGYRVFIRVGFNVGVMFSFFWIIGMFFLFNDSPLGSETSRFRSSWMMVVRVFCRLITNLLPNNNF